MTDRQPVPRLRVAVIAVVTLAAAWFVATRTFGTVFARVRPTLALSVSPGNAEANANHAVELFTEEPLHPDWPAIAAAARSALSRAPGNVPALSMLGAYADTHGQKARAERLFTRSDALSRHDQFTQIYLIEAAVARGDIAGALGHYNAALSTSRSSADLLMPTLAAASADPAVARPLATLLAARPVWWQDFARRLVNTPGAPGAGFPILLAALRLDPADSGERGVLAVALGRLVDAGQSRLAYDFYRRATGAPRAPATIRNGDFEAQNRLSPFDWSIRDGNGATGYVQPRDGSNALFVQADGTDVEVANQRLLLAPGRYVLAARMGSGDGAGEIGLQLHCTSPGGGGAALAALRVPPGSAARDYRATVVVPAAGCAAQRLGVTASTADDGAADAGWVDAIAITPAP